MDAGAQGPEPLCCFHRLQAVSLIKNGAAGLEPALVWDACTTGGNPAHCDTTMSLNTHSSPSFFR